MKNYNLIYRCILITTYLSTICFSRELGKRKHEPNGDNVISYCPPCDMRGCQLVSTDNCNGIIMKDSCGCCPVCSPLIESSRTEAATASFLNNETQTDACAGIECQRHEICWLNIQGLPVCRCPTKLYCKNKPRQKVCSSDNETFPSICNLKMAACNENRKITVLKKGSCEIDPNKEERARQREERIREREAKMEEKRRAKELKRQQRRQEKETNAKPRRERRKPGNRKTGTKGTRTEADPIRDQRKRDRKMKKRLERQAERGSGPTVIGRQSRRRQDTLE